MNNFLKNSTGSLAIALVLINIFGCGGRTTNETRIVSAPNEGLDESGKQLSEVDKIFILGKGFASGKTTAKDVKDKFDSLSATELKELYVKQEGASLFSVLMAVGSASNESIAIMDKIINADKVPARDPFIGKKIVQELISPTRPKGEDPASLKKLLETVLIRYPEQSNNLIKVDGSFNAQLLESLASSLDAAKLTPIIDKLNKKNLEEFVAWAMSNRPVGKVAFKTLYDKAASIQQLLRNIYLEKSIHAPPAARVALVESLIDEARDWGIGDAAFSTNNYDLPALTPGTVFSGTIAKVLSRFAIEENKRAGAVPRAAFLELRKYAQKMKTLMGDAAFKSYIDPAPAPGVVNIKSQLTAILKITHYEDWAGYYLAVEEPADAISAAAQPFTEVTNAMVRELYGLVITSHVITLHADALALAALHFLHEILERPLDADVAYVVNEFLNDASNGVPGNEVPLLNDDKGTGAPLPIQIVARIGGRPASDDPRERKKIFDRLLQNDTGSAVSKLTDLELAPLVAAAFANRGPGGGGYQQFTEIYDKIAAAAVQTKLNFMHSELLTLASNAGIGELQGLISEITDPADPWKLGVSIETAIYTLNGVSGTLMWVLTDAMIKAFPTDKNAYTNLRGFATAIKARLGNAKFVPYITTILPENGGAMSVFTMLSNTLNPVNLDDFTNYYLANESVQDVFDASLRPESQVPNGILRNLYDGIVGDVHSLAAALGALPGPGVNINRFIHYLLDRSADAVGDSRYLINKFLGSIATYGGTAAEQAQLLLTDAVGDLPLKLFLLRAPGFSGDDLGKKAISLARMLTHGTIAMLAGINAMDYRTLIPLLIIDPANFKVILSLLGTASNEAVALRSGLLAYFYAKGFGATKKFLASVTEPTNIWGLKASVTDAAQIYELDKASLTPPPHSGPLLFVLMQRAIDEAALSTKTYSEFREYAEILRNEFTAANYDNFVTATNFGPLIQPMKNYLHHRSYTLQSASFC